MSEEYFSIKVTYGPETPTHYREKMLSKGVIALYGYSKIWGEWRITELRFKRVVYPNISAVEKYLKERKAEIIRLLAAGQYNSKLKTEIQMFLAISQVKYLPEVRLVESVVW